MHVQMQQATNKCLYHHVQRVHELAMARGGIPRRRLSGDLNADLSTGALCPHPQLLYALQPTRQQKRSWHVQVINHGNICAHS
jgi:hypothetical protein